MKWAASCQEQADAFLRQVVDGKPERQSPSIVGDSWVGAMKEEGLEEDGVADEGCFIQCRHPVQSPYVHLAARSQEKVGCFYL